MEKEMELRCFIDEEEVDCETLKYIPGTEEIDDIKYIHTTHDDGC